jgi:hypothetical protein
MTRNTRLLPHLLHRSAAALFLVDEKSERLIGVADPLGSRVLSPRHT